MTTIYVTKYALTAGPFKVEARLIEGKSMATYRAGDGYPIYVHGKDFWLTESEALADCERRRAAKLASIEKQKKKLNDMKFMMGVAKQ